MWHASCLHTTPPFPIRTQDAIVCGEACWLELTEALTQEGRPNPTQEHSLPSRRFLPRTHSTSNTTHPFPLVTYPAARTNKRRPPSPNADAAGPRPTTVSHSKQPLTKKRAGESTSLETASKKQRLRTVGTKRKGAPSSKTPRKSATKKKPKLSLHINPWTISSGQLRRGSQHRLLWWWPPLRKHRRNRITG